ncbi:hypothetical protein NIES4071_20600 [Calothrix sp. NIES-4071]|nr:hypothetical protein NIES4071_20600 [Calothrix sp. NIES-4071]BAZ56392.1 hypothetical protein NIES4105_20550 [Calothrix sp. NIES-4105]
MLQTSSAKIPVGYITQASDTSFEIERILVERWQQMLPHQKTKLIKKSTVGCWKLCLIGILHDLPGATTQAIRREFIRRKLGDNWIEVLCNQDNWENLVGIEAIETIMEDALWLAVKLGRILEELGIPYLVGGSVASSLLGEPRATLDLDLVVDVQASQIELLVDTLTGEFYISIDAVRDAVERKALFNAIHLETTEKADFFILGNDEFSREKLRRRQLYTLSHQGNSSIYIYSAEDIILQKLRWYRMGMGISDRQWRDTLGVLKVQASKLDFEYLQQWGSNLGLDDLLERALLQAGLENR